MTFWSNVDQELADEWHQGQDNLASAIADIANGNQMELLMLKPLVYSKSFSPCGLFSVKWQLTR